jgi:hypothetical protein
VRPSRRPTCSRALRLCTCLRRRSWNAFSFHSMPDCLPARQHRVRSGRPICRSSRGCAAPVVWPGRPFVCPPDRPILDKSSEAHGRGRGWQRSVLRSRVIWRGRSGSTAPVVRVRAKVFVRNVVGIRAKAHVLGAECSERVKGNGRDRQSLPSGSRAPAADARGWAGRTSQEESSEAQQQQRQTPAKLPPLPLSDARRRIEKRLVELLA